MALPRQVKVGIAYASGGALNASTGSSAMAAVTAMTYTDIADGESDSVSVTLADRNKAWSGALMPERGAVLATSIVTTNWNGEEGTKHFTCGNFVLDDITLSGRPLSCILEGVSIPADVDFKTLAKSKTWEDTTISGIAAEIAAAAGVTLVFEAEDIQIAEIEQNSQTDSAFLYSLCEKYGLGMKVYHFQIVIYDYATYEEAGAVAALTEVDMLDWSYNTTLEGTYTGVSLSYTDPDLEEVVEAMIGEEGRLYYINTQAANQYDAELIATAALNAANRKIETMSITIKANNNIVATQCVTISGIGSAVDGKYFVDKARHSIGSSGYTMQLTLHKVQEAIKVTAPVAEDSGGESYTVASGDTLWDIAKKYYGSGTKYYLIYEANEAIIEAEAKSHGKASSANGHWIWPGTSLTIPAED